MNDFSSSFPIVNRAVTFPDFTREIPHQQSVDHARNAGRKTGRNCCQIWKLSGTSDWKRRLCTTFHVKAVWRLLFLIDLSWTCSSFPIENERFNRNSGPIPLHINFTPLRKSYWTHDPSGQFAASCHTFLISLAWCFTWHCHYDYRRRNAWLVQSYAWPKRLRIACARSNVQCWRCCWGFYVNLNLKNGHEWLDFCKLINASSNIGFTFVHFTN